MPDLWPIDLPEEPSERSPVAILQEQAALLGKKTKNRVEAEVRQLPPSLKSSGSIRYAFYIVAPTLGGYRYELFWITLDVLQYPLKIEMDGDIFREIQPRQYAADSPETAMVSSEEEFLDILTQILQAKKTRRIIGSLLSQVVAWLQP